MNDPLAPWNLGFGRERPDLFIPGSPERCIARRVVEDAGGGLWVLERIAPGQAARREALGRLLAALAAAGLAQACAYRPCADGFTAGFTDGFNGGRYVARDDGDGGALWQISPFVAGEPLDAPGYTAQDLPGEELADVLARLARAAQAASASGDMGTMPEDLGAFSPAAYVDKLLSDVRRHAPDIHVRAAALAVAVRPFLDQEPELPRVLCHGDLHPQNAVWRGGRILAVIDWEFAGLRHALYDIANTLGCLGIENPDTFRRGAGAAMLRRLAAEGLLPASLRPLLPAAILASRFAWLSEWLRKGDSEMVAMELDYMELLGRSCGA
ncbi:aminoglycoside phosphotransferase [Desulfovibrio sp. X2]|uniref:phosphotransferase n=1 Tax=Desulfovibrio sp. X2 TaxID=941449 RepID=UPI000358F206|nr:phosphotransferase [Desulfovibrio sp. X2]EPR37565.1 aminoglycoside phosphotransferase [Desulfovibrio sp. X2]